MRLKVRVVAILFLLDLVVYFIFTLTAGYRSRSRTDISEIGLQEQSGTRLEHQDFLLRSARPPAFELRLLRASRACG